MPTLEGPFGPIVLPDTPPPVRAAGEHGDQQVLMDWAASLEDALERLDIAPAPPFLRFVAYGLLNPELDGEGGLGVMLYAAGERVGRVGSLVVEQREFPVVVRRFGAESQSSGGDPRNATRTCWAHSRRTGKDGFLSAKHIVRQELKPDLQIALVGGGIATLVDIAPDCIDAAFFAHPISGSVPLVTRQDATLASMAMVMRTDGTNFGGPITAVTHPRGVWAGASAFSAVPIRFLIDAVGVVGDSGALVATPISQEGNNLYVAGLGLYLGELEVEAHGRRWRQGLCQSLDQVCQLMDLTNLRFAL